MTFMIQVGGYSEFVVPAGISFDVCSDVGDNPNAIPVVVSKVVQPNIAFPPFTEIVDEFLVGYKTYTNTELYAVTYRIDSGASPTWYKVGPNQTMRKFVSAPEYTLPRKSIILDSVIPDGPFGLDNYLSGIVEVTVSGPNPEIATVPSFTDLESSGLFRSVNTSKELIIYNKSIFSNQTLELDDNTGHALYAPNATNSVIIPQYKVAVLRITKVSPTFYTTYLLSLS